MKGRVAVRDAAWIWRSSPSSENPLLRASFEDSLSDTTTYSAADADDWETDERLRHIERELRINKKHSRSAAESGDKHTRIDSAHRKIAERHRLKPVRAKSGTDPKRGPANFAAGSKKMQSAPPRDSAVLVFLTWTAILLGVAALLGGGISLGCSVLNDRPDFWNFGLPFIVGGQVVLLVGLVMQLDRVGRENRTAAAKLDEVDEELHDLKTAAALLGTAQSPSSSAFTLIMPAAQMPNFCSPT